MKKGKYGINVMNTNTFIELTPEERIKHTKELKVGDQLYEFISYYSILDNITTYKQVPVKVSSKNSSSIYVYECSEGKDSPVRESFRLKAHLPIKKQEDHIFVVTLTLTSDPDLATKLEKNDESKRKLFRDLDEMSRLTKHMTLNEMNYIYSKYKEAYDEILSKSISGLNKD